MPPRILPAGSWICLETKTTGALLKLPEPGIVRRASGKTQSIYSDPQYREAVTELSPGARRI